MNRRLVMGTLALLALGLALGTNKNRLVADLPSFTMEVVFATPQTLATALGTTSTYNLTALRTTVELDALGYASDVPVRTIERTVDPPYSSGPIAPIESAWWQLEWEGAEEFLVQAADPGWPTGAAWDELSSSIGAQMQALEGIEGCWDDDSCPAVTNVVRVLAEGSLSDLHAITASPLVTEVRFQNGMFTGPNPTDYVLVYTDSAYLTSDASTGTNTPSAPGHRGLLAVLEVQSKTGSQKEAEADRNGGQVFFSDLEARAAETARRIKRRRIKEIPLEMASSQAAVRVRFATAAASCS